MKFKLFIKPHAEEIVQAQVHQASTFTDQLADFVKNDGRSCLLTVYNETDLWQIPFEHITLITIITGKTYAITNQNKKYLIRKRLYQLMELVPDNFWQINKSSIANRKQIARFTMDKEAGVNVIFKNGLTDYVSRRCFAKIRKELKS